MSQLQVHHSQRAERLDALRGVALLWMATFHFFFDLKMFGLIQTNFYKDPLWTTQRAAIVSLFLFCAGAAQVLSVLQGKGENKFWLRWLQIAACALVVTCASVIQFPKSYISFGVLHAIAVMMVLARWISRSPLSAAWVFTLGVAIVLAGCTLEHAFFDTRLRNWVGFVTFRPPTEDYVPLFPWFGVMLWGVAAGMAVAKKPNSVLWGQLPSSGRSFWKGLATMGRWSLSFYMLHQVVLIASIMVVMSIVR